MSHPSWLQVLWNNRSKCSGGGKAACSARLLPRAAPWHAGGLLQGDAADEELLLEENVDSADAFVAVTNAEEANILSAMLANTTVVPFDLLHDPFAGADGGPGRSLLAEMQWDQFKQIGRYAEIANPDMPDRHSSTGQVAIHAALIPGTYKIILFGRNLPLSGPKSKPEPNVGGNVSTVYDVKVRPVALRHAMLCADVALFCCVVLGVCGCLLFP